MMAGEVSDVLSTEDVVTDTVTMPDSEDLLSIEADVAMLSATVNEAPDEQRDGSSKQSDVVAKEGVKLDAELTEANYEGEEVDVSGQKNVESSLPTEEPVGQDVLMEAQVDLVSEPATGTVAEVDAAEVVVTDNEESLDHHVIDNSVGSSLRACSNVGKQPFSNLSKKKVADVIDTTSQVEAVFGDVVTDKTASLSESNVQKGGDMTPAHETHKKASVEVTKLNEPLVLADGDRSTICDEPVSTAPCSETSVKEIEHSVVKLPDSNLNSTEDNYLMTDKERKHLQRPQVPSISKKDDSFSFDLPMASEGGGNKVSQPFSMSQDLAASGTAVGSPVAFASTPKSKKRSTEISQGANESSEPKRRRSTARKSGKKGDQSDEATLLKQLEREERPANMLTPVGSGLPTINFSTSQPAAFQQPFSDLQQLQLRAQIFVYGSLIQGNAPDEACLISAFGGPDGGRSIWEKPWRKCMERIQIQISQTNMKSPVLQTSGKSKPVQTNKRKRKRNAPLLGSAGKSDSLQTVNPTIPLSSPFQILHTSALDGLQISEIPQIPLVDHNLPPLYPFQSPVKNTGHGSPWSSHVSRPLPWVSSAQTSAWDPNTTLPAFPSVEPVKLIPVKESPLIPYSTANYASATLPVPSTAAPALSSETAGDIQVFKSLGQIAKESKAKKPKKVSVSNNASQPLETASHSSGLVLVDPGSNIQNASTKPSPLSAAIVLTSSATPLLSSVCFSLEDKDSGKKDAASEDSLHRVNEAKLHAEEAAACAEAAVTHGQHVCDQLDKQKNSGLAADIESKVASAAAAIAAAVSVAKAAAAAARLASEAALLAKLMAEESLVSSECIKVGSVNEVALSDGVNLLDEVTPASILKGENSGNMSTSIIGAAKEAARRKIESALSASMHAKNLDAIVKAAELAAEAVAQAGRVVAMGGPLPLTALVHSEPDGHGKVSQRPPEQMAISNSAKEVSFNNEATGRNLTFSKIAQDGSLNPPPADHTKSENQPAPDIVSLKRSDAHTTSADLASVSVANEDVNAGAEVPTELVYEKKSPSTLCQKSGNIVETSIDKHIKEGSVVEVFKEWGTVKAAWFAAKVLELKDDEVYVSYTEKQTGNGEYKEWITVSCEDNTAPIVRIAHPMTVVPSDGARKRRRSAIGRRSWEIGDKVDAWMQDCWWEGLIIEKNSKDALSLTVQFPAQGETHVVKAWNLRPSLIWKEGAWVQWSNPNESVRSRHEDATPRGKRQRLNSPQIDVKGKRASESHDQSGLMDFSEHDKKFHVGKITRDDGKVNAQRMVRTGLWEGSKVIFGVPKPGKKRKFMDVGNSSEPLKTSRIPISRGPHGWKNSSPRTEAQQKTSRSKPKDPSITSAPSEIDEGRELDDTADNDSASGPDRRAETESCSVADEATDDSILISSLARPPSNSNSKRGALGNVKAQRANRGKQGLSEVKKKDVKEDKVFSGTSQQEASDAAEPRRSNRRIQPTSRLLEGLQTSLNIAKVPSTVNRK